MIRKILFIIISTNLLLGCGYSPIYKNSNNTKFKIFVAEMYGDNEINNKIRLKLKKYSKNVSVTDYEIQINSSIDKIITTKDPTGKATDYEIKIQSSFNIKNNDETDVFNVEEKFKYKRKNENIDQMEYERTIKNNMIDNIVKKLVSYLSRKQ